MCILHDFSELSLLMSSRSLYTTVSHCQHVLWISKAFWSCEFSCMWLNQTLQTSNCDSQNHFCVRTYLFNECLETGIFKFQRLNFIVVTLFSYFFEYLEVFNRNILFWNNKFTIWILVGQFLNQFALILMPNWCLRQNDSKPRYCGVLWPGTDQKQ